MLAPALRAVMGGGCQRGSGTQSRLVTRAVRTSRARSTRRRQSHALVLAAALLASGCLSQARRAMRTDAALLTHYSQAPIAGVGMEQLDALLDTLPLAQPLCLSLSAPCVTDVSAPRELERTFCLRWGRTATCFLAQQVPEGLGVRALSQEVLWGPAHGWLFEALDPLFEAVRGQAQEQADDEVARSEERSVAVNTFWAQLRGAGVWPTLGAQVQGGYRRWLSQYVLVSAGGGYERGLLAFSGAPLRRDAVLLTARVELSSYDEAFSKRWWGLPALAGHFGVTGAIGVGPTAGWAMRGFVGFSCIVPLSFELGVALERFPNSTATGPRFYLAAGLGL
jgi:hypothetical protein